MVLQQKHFDESLRFRFPFDPIGKKMSYFVWRYPERWDSFSHFTRSALMFYIRYLEKQEASTEDGKLQDF